MWHAPEVCSPYFGSSELTQKQLLPLVLWVFPESLPISGSDLGQWDHSSVFLTTHNSTLPLKAKKQSAGYTLLLINWLKSYFIYV